MRKVYIKDLKVSDVLLSHNFAVKEFTKKKGKTGKEYFNVTLSDKTGQVNAKVWGTNFNEVDQNAKAGDVVSVTGRVDEFLEKPQVIIEKMKIVKDFDPADFLVKGERDQDEIWKEIQDEVSDLKDKAIKDLINKIFSDEKFVKKYKEVPAAEIVHQDYIGGLLEHTYEMMVVARTCKNLYTQVRWAELLYGVLFHDVGKVEELNPTGVTLERTKSGALLGHLIQGLLFLDKQFPKDFDAEKKDRLLHMVASHNGKKELGSPVVPMTLEAILLSAIDDLSFMVGAYFTHIRKNDADDRGLTGYNRYLGASMLLNDY